MLFILLIINLTLCHGYPSTKLENDSISSEDTKELSSILQNEVGFVENVNVEKENSTCNKTIDYSAIIKTIQEINNLRDKSLKTLEMIENSIVEREVSTLETTMESITNSQTETSSTTPPITTSYEFSITETTSKDEFLNFTVYDNSTSLESNDENSTTSRQTRQQMKLNDTVPLFEKQEEEEEEEEAGGGLIGAILSGFLGSLSKPDGSVDVNAVVSVIGMLSAENEDGSYDFSGLSDTLTAFFGGDDEDGGGSDVGSFAGGLLAAVLKGVARPGAKGAGTFLGNIAKQVLPAISGPAEVVEGATTLKPQVDAGGFLGGLLNTLFGEPSKDGSKQVSTFTTIKNNVVKFVFSAFSSILGTSSSSSGSDQKKAKLQYPK